LEKTIKEIQSNSEENLNQILQLRYENSRLLREKESLEEELKEKNLKIKKMSKNSNREAIGDNSKSEIGSSSKFNGNNLNHGDSKNNKGKQGSTIKMGKRKDVKIEKNVDTSKVQIIEVDVEDILKGLDYVRAKQQILSSCDIRKFERF